MKTLTAMSLFIFASATQLSAETLSQSDTVQTAWTVYYTGPDSSGEVSEMVVDAEGNIYITGQSAGDYATVKYNASGVQQWAGRYDFSAEDEPRAIARDASGNVYVTGSSDGGATIFDIATIKYNSAGVQQWVMRYNNPTNRSDFGSDVIVDGSGNVYVAGSSRVLDNTNNQRHYDIVVLKYNSSGIQQWLASFNHNNPVLGNSDDFARAMTLDKEGNIYVTGTRDLLNQVDIVTVKYNSAGAQQWIATYGGPGLSFDDPSAIALDEFGNAYVAGTSVGSGTGEDIVLIKYNAAGAEQWVKRYTGSGSNPDGAGDMGVDASGNIYLTGSTNVSGNNNFVTIKYDPSGNQQWIAYYDSPAHYSDGANALALDQLGNVYVTGSSMSQSLTTDFLTIKYNSSGIQQWVGRYAGPKKFDVAKAIAVDGSNNVMVTGESLNIGWTTLKYVQIPVTSVEDEAASVPSEFSLWQNYPNPFNPSTTIRFDLPKSSFVTLQVYDLLGNEVATLVNEFRLAGSHKIDWTVRGLPSGLYFYRLQAGVFVDTKKLVVMK